MIQFPRKIRDRVLLVAVLPVMLITLLVVVILSSARLSETADSLEERGRIMASNLALTSEFGLFSGDRDALDRIATGFIENHPDVQRIDILYTNNEVAIMRYRDNQTEEGDRWLSKLLNINPVRVFEAKAGSPSTEPPLLTEYIGDESASAGHLGRVRVILSDSSLVASEREILHQGIWMLLAGILLSLLIAIPIGSTITAPLQRLLKMTQELRHGDLRARVSDLSSGEFGALEKGFNALADETHQTQMQLQDKIDDATSELNRSIQELRIKNKELGSARTAAMAAAEEKEAFLARMSHEIRTPLNAIIGFSRILERETMDHRSADYVHVINQASTQLLFLVNDILQYSRIQAGHMQLDRRRFNLTEKIEDLVAMVSHQAHENGLELISLIHSDVPEHVTGDPDRIGQILLNLLNNAVKFTRSGHVFLEVRGNGAEETTLTVDFYVSDTGPGIDPRYRNNLFEPFYQGDGTLTRRHGGAGLGLAIAKRLATAMDGDIDIMDKPGHGAKFRVSIPLPASDRVATAGERPEYGKLDIFLYEPHPLSRRALRVMLSRIGRVVINSDRLSVLTEHLGKSSDSEGAGERLIVIGLANSKTLDREAEGIYRSLRERYSDAILFVLGKDAWYPGTWATEDPLTDWISKPIRRATLSKTILEILPRTQAEKPDRDPKTLSGITSVSPWATVLYVEDNAFNRLLLERMLASRGYRMDALESSADVDLQTLNRDYRLIFTDLHLPGIDGASLARQMKESLGSDCPPIVLVTADALHKDSQQGDDSPFDDLLTKPIGDEALDRILKRWTGKQGDPMKDGEPIALDPHFSHHLRQELTRLLTRLRAALDNHDTETIADSIHQLKGLVGLGERPDLMDGLRILEGQVESDADYATASETTDSMINALADADS